MQGGRVVSQLHQLLAPPEGRRRVEQLDQGHHGDDTAAAPRARRHRRVVEVTGERPQGVGLGAVEQQALTVVVDDLQGGLAHARES